MLLTQFTDGKRRQFNPSIVEFEGKEQVVIRDFEHRSQLLLNGLPIIFDDARCNRGQEDPRLFVYRKALWVAFVGVCRGAVRQMYGRIEWPNGKDANPVVNEVYRPSFQGRSQRVEKNWSFFEHHNKLYAIYSMHPHIVIEVSQNTGVIVQQYALRHVYELNGPLHGGFVMRHPDDDCKFIHWFHSYEDGVEGHIGRVYSYSAYVLNCKFEIVNWINKPLLTALDPRLSPKPEGYLHSVVFPGGGVIVEQDGIRHFKLAVGVHDQWCEYHEWDIDEVLKASVDVTPPQAATPGVNPVNMPKKKCCGDK